MENIELYFDRDVRYCPECGSYLERNPARNNAPACYPHGDFLMTEDRKLVWVPVEYAIKHD